MLRNRGDGTLAGALHPSIGETGPSGLAVGDLDGDGRPDFVVVMGSSSNSMGIAAVLDGGGPAVTLSLTSLSFGNQVINTTSVAKTPSGRIQDDFLELDFWPAWRGTTRT